MKKGHFIILTTLILIIFSVFFCSPLLATEDNIDTDNNQTEDMSEIEIQRRERLNKEILGCIEEIKQQLKTIDYKLGEIKKKPEYENYPAIRLNIDTPIFGLVSVVNQRLKITSEVSAADVANSYSIRDIIKHDNIKVPSFSVASIIVITRDIKLDENIIFSDANTAILKLMQYINQTKSINEFLDKQISKIYVGYISKEKSDKINELNGKITNINTNILNLDKPINVIHITKTNEEKHNELANANLKYKKKSYDLSEELKNVLISDSALLEIEKQVLSLESELVALKEQVSLTGDKMQENLDIEKMLLEFREELIYIKEDVEKYIENSVEEKKIENEDETKPEENSENNEADKNNEQDETTEEVRVYDVTSENTIEYMDSIIKTIDEKIKTILGENAYRSLYEKETPDEELPEEVANKEQVTGEVVKQLSKEEKENLIEELYKIYLEYISRENKFYLDNMNLLIKDTTSKISELSKHADTDVISDMKYVYLELPSILDRQTKIYYNKSSIIGTKNMTTEIVKQLSNLVNSNKKARTEYNSKIS